MFTTLSILFYIFFGVSLHAGSITENFTDTLNKDSGSSAVWNFANGYVHPTLHVANYQAFAQPVVPTGPMPIGDGHHGAFNLSTYSNFGTVVGNVITIDATVFPVLEFSSFQLDSAYTLTSINGPLVIYSLSTVEINGTILCSGNDGSDAVGVSGGVGGVPRCGGSFGGNGGNVTTSGTKGLPLAGPVTGGGGGNYIGAAPGAGGGGGGTHTGNNGLAGFNSVPATNTGGTAGIGVGGENHDFTIIGGYGAGGGGSGSNTEGGAGGGASGGTVIIHAVGNVTISNTGSILALGGNGGAANSGGGGGGGGGGSVKIFTAGNLHLDSGTPVDVSGGIGSVPAVANAGDGGDGSYGRTWLSYSTFSGIGSESHPGAFISFGTIEYKTTPETVISKSYDTQSTQPTFISVSTSPSSPDIVIDISGSNDNFVSDDTGWISASLASTLEKKRYIKFRVTLTNSNALVPTTIDSLTITYDSTDKNVFEFGSGCGNINKQNNNNIMPLILLMLLPILICLRLKGICTDT